MQYNSGNNRASDFKSAERVAKQTFVIRQVKSDSLDLKQPIKP